MNNQRQQHDVKQGTPEWISLRLNFIGASEISAVMGLSRTKKRTEILRLKKTGLSKEFSDYVQREILDKGHQVEAMARPIVENKIGEALYPTIWTAGNLLASCDGLTAMDETGFEHKQYNAEYFEMVQRGEVPEEHMPQVQQCLLVTGAEKWLFVVSDGTEERMASVWVYPDQTWFDRIQAAADQFFIDLESFQPEPEIIPAKAEAVMALPALSIQVGGSISIQSNLDRFGERLKLFIEETNAKPETDQDFANLEQACKVLKDAEDALKQAESNALAQTASVDEMRRTVSFLADMARNNRLTFEKLVKSEKENRKNEIVLRTKDQYAEHCRRLQAELPVAFVPKSVDFAAEIKGKKSLSSMRDAVATALANAKIEADALARDLREKHAWYIENAGEYSFLFSDLSGLIYRDADAFKAVAQNRIAEHKEQERIKAEQAAKAQAEREERIRQEAEEKAKREERERIAAEQKADAAEQDSRKKIITQAVQEVDQYQEQLKTGFKEPTQGAPEISKSPGRQQLIQAIANKFFVTPYEAEQWLIAEFSTN